MTKEQLRKYCVDNWMRMDIKLARKHLARKFKIDDCKDQDCMLCGVLVCPHGEPLHFSQVECPACMYDDEVRK